MILMYVLGTMPVSPSELETFVQPLPLSDVTTDSISPATFAEHASASVAGHGWSDASASRVTYFACLAVSRSGTRSRITLSPASPADHYCCHSYSSWTLISRLSSSSACSTMVRPASRAMAQRTSSYGSGLAGAGEPGHRSLLGISARSLYVCGCGIPDDRSGKVVSAHT